MIVRARGRLRLALPWLEAALGVAAAEGRSVVRMPAAEWLLARGRATTASAPPWREWLLSATDTGAGLLRQCPAGPSARALHADGPPEGTWACARPVHLMTAIDHLQLAPGSVDIDAVESSALLEDINRHLDGRGFRFHAPHASGDWQLECAEPIDCTCVEPEDAAGRNVRDLMPGGRDGARVCSLMNEIQMLLHEHPVNRERASRGGPAINSLWIWGFGRLGAAEAANLPLLCTDDAWLSGIWRLHGATSRPLGELAAFEAIGGGDVLVAWSNIPGGSMDEALADAERRCFEPVRAALRSGGIGTVDILLGERACAVDPSARFRFWRRDRPLAEALT